MILKSMIPYLSNIGAIVFECSLSWYGSNLNDSLKAVLDILFEFRATHPYVYMLSRRGLPKLYNLSNEETLLETLRNSYKANLQFDCLLTRQPFYLETSFTP